MPNATFPYHCPQKKMKNHDESHGLWDSFLLKFSISGFFLKFEH